jgi:hypothetical protein
MFDAIAELIHAIWRTDTGIRTSSALGESEHSRRYRKVFGVICVVLIAACVVLGIIY